MPLPTMMTDTFEWDGAKITVRQPIFLTLARQWQLAALVVDHPNLPAEMRGVTNMLLFYLANTVSVEGDLGFPVPSAESATSDEVLAFIIGLAGAPQKLGRAWDNHISALTQATNDPDLRPKGDVDPKGADGPTSSSDD